MISNIHQRAGSGRVCLVSITMSKLNYNIQNSFAVALLLIAVFLLFILLV